MFSAFSVSHFLSGLCFWRCLCSCWLLDSCITRISLWYKTQSSSVSVWNAVANRCTVAHKDTSYPYKLFIPQENKHVVSALCIVSASCLGACFLKLRKKTLVELIRNQRVGYWKVWSIWWFMDSFVFYLLEHHPSLALKCSVLHNVYCDLRAPVGHQPHAKLAMERCANPGDPKCSL